MPSTEPATGQVQQVSVKSSNDQPTAGEDCQAGDGLTEKAGVAGFGIHSQELGLMHSCGREKFLDLKHTQKEDSAGQDAGTLCLGFCFYLLSMPK